jgi:ApbE superfamily uncharacterized protein (UPF0280 family)
MPYEQSIARIDRETVIAECGPMRLIIKGWYKGKPQIHLARQAAEQSFMYLERIARHRSELSRPFPVIKTPPPDTLAIAMVQSADAVGDFDLTPMAAVAGTIADAVADWLVEHGVTKVIVDNGGDISIRLVENETVSVGIRPEVNSPHISHVLCLNAGRVTYGVTTSGLGGRSFTRGIASAVTVLAATASVADAASTAIANACFVKDRRIVQLPAEKIDPDSDLMDILVTTAVEPLDLERKLTAIKNAQEKAEYLVQKGVILGAFIALEGQFAITDSMQAYISQVSETAG